MFKKFNLFVLMLLIVGQTILGPMATVGAVGAEGIDSPIEAAGANESTETDSEEKVDSGEKADSGETGEKPENSETDGDGDPNKGKPETTEENESEGEDSDKSAVKNNGETGDSSDEEEEAEIEPNSMILASDEDDDSVEKTGFKLTLNRVLDYNQQPITDDNKLDINSLFFIDYSWSLDNDHTYKANDQVTFKLPDQLNIFQALSGDLLDGGLKFAEYQVNTNGTVTITFTDAVENLSDIQGTVWIMSKLDQSKLEIDDDKITIGPIEDGSSITVPVDMSELGATISKSGSPLPSFSPTEIEWTIIVDAGIVKQNNGVVTDTLPAGLSYKAGSLTIDGAAVNPNVSGQDLTINLENFTGTKEIKFITTIDAFEAESFNNTAYYAANNTDEISNGASVAIERGKPIEKTAGNYNSEERTIEWTVNLNFDGQDVSAGNLVDTWDAALGMNLVPGSITLQEVALDDEGNPSNVGGPASPPTVTNPSNTGFTVALPAMDGPYQLTYKTKLDNRVLDGYTVNNSVSWNSETDTGSKDVKPKLGSKSHSNVDYQAKTVDWTITYNSDRQPMTDTVIEDTLPKGLELIGGEDGIIVAGAGSATVTKTFDSTTNKITVRIDGEINDEITVSYKTSFDYSVLNKGDGFKNTAYVSWQDDKGNEIKNKEVTSTFTPNPLTQNDGSKSGSYDPVSKEITWTVIANYQQNSYTNLVVRDTPEGNQKLIANSIKVYEATVQSGGGVQEDSQVSVDPDIDGNNFTVELGNTKKTYKIVYKTSLEDLSDIAASYSNSAFVSEKGEDETEIPATVSITNGGSYAAKTGNQNGNVMDWTVTVNATQATLNNVVLTDTLSENQEFIENSIKVYSTVQGTTNTDQELSEGVDYTVSISEGIPQTLTLKFNGKIDRAYVVEYSTLYFAAHGEEVSNSYKVTGNGEDGNQEQAGTEAEKIEQFSGGDASGTAGYLKVKKVANDDPDKVFAGITFNLIDPYSNKVLRTGTTDKDGFIDFGRLKFGTYELEEIEAPIGYVKPTGKIEVKIDTAYNPDDSETIQIFEVINEKIRQGFEFKKVDANDTSKGLEGAIFELRKAGETDVIMTVETGADGKFSYGELEAGHYELVEIKAPVGYKLNDTPIPFEIVANQTEATQVGTSGQITNNINEDSVTLQKFKENRDGTLDESVSLEGAEFTLYHENGDIVTNASGDELKGLSTDELGELIVENLKPGKYYFLETKAPRGYQLDRNKKHEFEIKTGESTVIKVGNKVRTGGGGWTPPTDPEDPTDPEEPGEDPEDPTDPEEPGEDPEDPTDPEEPGEDPEDPTDPKEPGTDPKDPTDPKEPGKDPKDPTDKDDDGSIKGDGDEKSDGTKGGGSKDPSNLGDGTGLKGQGDQAGKDGSKNGDLPNTATNIYNLILLGAALLVIGASILIYRRRTA